MRVSGPVCGGTRGRAFAPGCGDIPGYVVAEFLLEGEATAYRSAEGSDYDVSGRWDAVACRSAPYRTRILVVRPAEAAGFGGTVVVNWQNVTRGFEMGAPPPDLAALGLAWVGVSAQQAGHHGFPAAEHLALRGWDPPRYATLSHPGDDFSFDIFSQAARVVGPGRCTASVGPDPMGGLPVTRMVAAGTSQSALRLRSYINAIQPLGGHFDAFLLTLDVGLGAMLDTSAIPPGGPLRIPSVPVRVRDDMAAPVMVVNSETEVPLLYAVRQPDTDRFRLWEIAGSAHISWPPAEAAELAQQLEQLGIDAGVVELRDGAELVSVPDDTNVVSHAPVVRAALRHILRWLEEGVPPPRRPLVEIQPGDPPSIGRDEHGNALGGVRLPDVEVPLARHCGLRPDEPDILARICGSSVTFPRGKLRRMYSGRSEYLERYAAALDSAVAAGVLVQEERPAMMAAAEAGAARLLTW